MSNNPGAWSRLGPWILPSVWAIAFIGTLGIAISAAFFAPASVSSMIQILAAVVSIPPVLFALAIAFGIAFRGQLSGLVERISEFGLGPGGALLRVGQAAPPEGTPPPPPLSEPDKATAKAPTGGGADATQVQALQAEVHRLLRNVRFRFHQYLAVFLAPISQAALRWLDTNARTPAPYTQFVGFLQTQGVTDPAYQINIWNALAVNGLPTHTETRSTSPSEGAGS
jgi:hypothetical protein